MFLFQQKVLNTEECCGESEHKLIPRKGNFLYIHHYSISLWIDFILTSRGNSILNACQTYLTVAFCNQ